MISRRSQMVVKSELEKLGINYTNVGLGEVEISGKISKDQLYKLAANLKLSGLELMVDDKKILVEKIVTTIIELVYYTDDQSKIILTGYLSQKLNHNYTYLSDLYFEAKGITIEHLYLTNRIERAKELMVYDDLKLVDIAKKLNFGTVAQLSYKFKRMTGLTPSDFKRLRQNKSASPEFL